MTPEAGGERYGESTVTAGGGGGGGRRGGGRRVKWCVIARLTTNATAGFEVFELDDATGVVDSKISTFSVEYVLIWMREKLVKISPHGTEKSQVVICAMRTRD